MSGSSRKLMGTTAAGGAELLAIEDCFSCFLYTGTGSALTITNGIDLAGEGGLVWIKERPNAESHQLTDTERGNTKVLSSDSTAAEATVTTRVTAFNSDGFSLGSNASVNQSATTYASWTWRKAPRWFDVVTYTGDGTLARAIPHNLGTDVGSIFVKRTDGSSSWHVYHKDLPLVAANHPYVLFLNTTDAITAFSTFKGGIPDSSNFYVDGVAGAMNQSGETYVAYLFAHDPLGESGDGSDGLIACGSYTGNGVTDGPEIDLGWEPQWLLVKRASDSSVWGIYDNMRGMSVSGADAYLFANLSNAEGSAQLIDLTPSGFKLNSSDQLVNWLNDTYIYIAIRRGPMRQPTSGTEVFAPVFGDGSGTPSIKTSFPVDMGMVTNRASGGGTLVGSRITGAVQLNTSSTSAESSNSFFKFDFQNGWHTWTGVNSGYINWNFRRAPGFFDVVAYTGDGVAGRTVSHNLGVAPEMMIVKKRDGVDSWRVYHSGLNGGTTPENYFVNLNNANTEAANSAFWNNTAPASTEFTVGTNVNGSGANYIAYLFATLPGVSKVGSYTGNGTSQNIDCGFTTGARFLLIKKADDTGHWQVYDTARGIVAGNDPRLVLNLTSAELTGYDFVDPYSGGFAVTSRNDTNENGYTYIYLAIA